jgi:hypothetical protein
VVINGKEYAYGGHNQRNKTGVYYTAPRFEPPGGTFRLGWLQGFTFHSEEEIGRVIKEVRVSFLSLGEGGRLCRRPNDWMVWTSSQANSNFNTGLRFLPRSLLQSSPTQL